MERALIEDWALFLTGEVPYVKKEYSEAIIR